MTSNVKLLPLPEPKFGDWLRGIYASEGNPTRDGMYVRTIHRTGRVNAGKFYELTDGKGKFWQYPAKSTERLPRTTATQAAELVELRSTIEALRAEREVICAEAVKYADKSGRLEAKVDRLAEALRPLADLDLTPDDFDKRPDSQPIYARNKTAITVGDVRKARVALRRGRTDGGSEVRTEDEILALAAADGGGA